MPELTTAWVTLAATTRGMEADIRRAFNRVERDAKINPKLDTSKMSSQGATAGRNFASRFDASAKLDPKIDRSKLSAQGDRAGRDFMSRFGSAGSSGASAAGSGIGFLLKGGIAGILTMAAGASIAAPFISGMKEAFETGIDFDKVANTFQGVTSSTVAQTNEMRAAARALGTDSSLAGASTSDAGRAMLELAKGGLTAQQAMEAARGTIQLATAGQLDAAEAAKIQSGAMNTFQLSAGDATRVADLLAAAANASAADVSDLGQALTQGGSVAAGFGTSIEDTLTALTMFSRFGVNGSDAGTMLKTALQAITDTGKPAQKAFDALGFSAYDAQGKFIGVEALMKNVAAASKNMSEQQFQAATNVLFGSDAMRASMIAANGGADAWDSASVAVRRHNAAADMAKANMQGMPGVMEGIDNAAEGLKLGVYDAFNAMAQAAGGGFLTSLEGISGWMGSHKADMIGFFGDLGKVAAESLYQLLKFGADGTRALAQLVNAAGDISGAILRSGAALKRITGDTKTADQWDAEADAMFGWGDGLYSTSDALDKAAENAKGFGGRIDEIAKKAQESARFTDALGGAIVSIEGKDIVLKDNTPEVLAKIDKTKYEIEHLPDGRVKVVPLTEAATSEMNAWRTSQGEQPVEISPKLSQSGASQWLAQLRGLAAGAPVPVAPGAATPVRPGGGLPGLMLPQPRAAGGLFDGVLPADAVLQRGSGSGLVQWAEAGTGIEAFIPIEGNRQRSLDIWAKTGQLLGVFEQGGIRGGDAALLSQVPAGSYNSSGDLVRGLGDCSSAVEDLVNLLDGRSTAGRSMSTGNAAEWLTANGFLPGSMPGAFNVGFNSSHMQATLPGGTPFNWGSDAAAARGGVGGTGAFDPALTERYYRPATGTGLGSFQALAASGDGTYEVDQQAVFDAETSVIKARNDLVEQRKQLAELEAKGTATESQLLAARNDVVEQERDVQSAEAKFTEAKQGKLKKTGGKGSSGGMGGESLGQSIVGGIFESLGVPNFMNLFETPTAKSAMALANWGFGFLGGGESDESGPGGGGPLGGAMGSIGLPNLANVLKPIGPQAVRPIDPNTTTHGQGAGALPGPSFNVTANGMDPRAITDRMSNAYYGLWRKNMSAPWPS